MSGTFPCVLFGSGYDDSPGALDADVRYSARFQERSLTWRRLSGVRCLSGGGRGRNGTHRLLLTTRILRAFQQVGMDVGDSGLDVRNVILDVGSDGMGVHDVVASGGDGCIRVCSKFPLEFES